MVQFNIDLRGKTVLVTGTAGFIGAGLVRKLLDTVVNEDGDCANRIIGIDNMNDYYDVNLKEARLAELEARSSFLFIKEDIADRELVSSVFKDHKPQVVVNLVAQAGVRYSITNSDAYIKSNIIGFYNILEACRHSYDDGASGVQHQVYASSSSVYGSCRQNRKHHHLKEQHPCALRFSALSVIILLYLSSKIQNTIWFQMIIALPVCIIGTELSKFVENVYFIKKVCKYISIASLFVYFFHRQFMGISMLIIQGYTKRNTGRFLYSVLEIIFIIICYYVQTAYDRVFKNK